MTRDEIQSLLPFLANESLTGDERSAIEQGLAEDAELQTELETLRAIRSTMQAQEEYSPGEVGLARLMRAVDSEAAAPSPAANVAPKRTANLVQKPWLWQSAAAVLLAVLVGQTLFQMPATETAQSDGYSLASGDLPADIDDGPRLIIGFAPGTTEADLRALLLDAGIQIAGGPDEQGLYQVTPADGASVDSASAILVASDLIEILELP